MSYALQAAGVNMSSYFANSQNSSLRNIYVEGKDGFPSARYNLAKDVYQLAVWVRAWYKRLCSGCGKESPKNKDWNPNEKWLPSKDKLDEGLFTWLKNQNDKGIIVMYDHWYDTNNNVRGHIDLWNGIEFRRGEPREVKYSSHVFFMPLY
jgi:Type VI secretion system (T6SS), amidase effector protein 4